MDIRTTSTTTSSFAIESSTLSSVAVNVGDEVRRDVGDLVDPRRGRSACPKYAERGEGKTTTTATDSISSQPQDRPLSALLPRSSDEKAHKRSELQSAIHPSGQLIERFAYRRLDLRLARRRLCTRVSQLGESHRGNRNAGKKWDVRSKSRQRSALLAPP